MSTNLIINQQTNLKNDDCLYTSTDINNDKLFNYNFLLSTTNNEKSRNEYINIPGLLQNTNYDMSDGTVDNSTLLRNGTIQDIGQSKRELDTRLFPGAPFMSAGQSTLKNPDLGSRLKYGEDTRVAKSVNIASSYSANNFIPLIPSIEENVQNIDHIIPTNWVRGGMSSRTVVRNIDYLKSCGIKK